MPSDTTTLGDSMQELRLAEEGEPIRATIKQIDGAAMFNTGWIGQGMLYETPTLYITFETSFGDIQVESHITNIEESGLKPLLLNAPFDPTEQVELQQLIGETVSIAPRGDKQFATIGWGDDTHYSESNKIVLRTDNLREVEDLGEQSKFPTSIESRSIDEMNSLLTTEMVRDATGIHGWIEANFEYDGISNGHHFFTATVCEETIYWAFDDSLTGVENIETFLSEIGIDYTPEEFSNETIWIKPLRDIHFTNRPEDDTQIDTREFWVAADAPKLPEKNPSLLEKLKDFFSVSSGGVDVSVGGNRDRKAKSSHTKDALHPSKEQTTPDVEVTVEPA